MVRELANELQGNVLSLWKSRKQIDCTVVVVLMKDVCDEFLGQPVGKSEQFPKDYR